MARREYSLLQEQQVGASTPHILRSLRGPVPKSRALVYKHEMDSLAIPIQERITDLKRSISLVRFGSDMSMLEAWDRLIGTVVEFSEQITQIVLTQRQDKAQASEMEFKLHEIERLYDTLHASMRHELEAPN
jgi:hypothetical protein